METQPKLLIVDLGSQYTMVIARTLREIGFRSVILSSKKAGEWLKKNQPKGIILSGGSASVTDANAPEVPSCVFDIDVPVLGICYGMQYVAQRFGGQIRSHHERREYGKATVRLLDDRLFRGVPEREIVVWASHGDSVVDMPQGFEMIAESPATDAIQAMTDGTRIWALQFHPEVTHTKYGKDILANFVVGICECESDWVAASVIDGIRSEVASVSSGKRAIIGFSGGVDSTVLSAIVAPVFGKRLLALCIDTGGLRKDELAEIRTNAKYAGVYLRVVRAAKRFQLALSKTHDAETKRKRFKKVYGRILEEEAKRFGAEFIMQGTLATDEIESGKAGNAALIKSHHNVGLGLKMDELHPFRNLFKYEVRDLGTELGLPSSVSHRQPFPGPGLYVRVIGKPATAERLSILRWADAEVTAILRKHGIYDDISQLVVGLLCVRTVGIKGDGRVYESSVVMRAVRTLDFMTVTGYQIPEDVRREITDAVTKHRRIVRVFYDETNKPPATTELE
ncbi:MAG: glutamine-hydrolyzing GMP synthase [Candidatus Moranbacteria bacterium]|nr:glutamine-hydrolyzing GMP synthase [Candidatus Moranbacteria bacterium]